MINKDFTLNALQKLVQINSVNPSLAKNGKGEAEIGQYIASIFQSFYMPVEIEELAPGRVNVTATWKGKGGGKSLLLNAHMDTVGTAGMKAPFSAEIKDGKLYGRGAYDMKASIAAILAVAKAIHEQQLQFKGDIIFSLVADEEYESIGAQSIAKKFKADAAIVTEPSNLQICLAHRGFAIFKATTFGKTAHGGNHHLGVDANMHMGLLLAELYKISKNLSRQKRHALCGEASMHIPLIEGGRSLFIYAHECQIMIERRTLPGETEDIVRAEIEQCFEKVKELEPSFTAQLETILWRSPYEISAGSAIVKHLKTAGKSTPLFTDQYIGHNWWEDSALFGEAGMETVIFGPSGGGIHENVEWVDIESVYALAEILFKTCQTYCND